MELNEKFLDLVKKNVPKDTTFFGIFLIGSQNYRLSNFRSDKDYIAFVIPKLFPTFLNYSKKIKEKEILLNPLEFYPTNIPSSITVKYKDIRMLFKGLLEGHLNFVELLFSREYYIEPKYSFIETFLKENKEDLCLLNPLNLLKGIQGMINSNLKNKTYNSNYSYRSYHAYRLINFVGAIALRGFKINPFTSFDLVPQNVLLELKEKGYSVFIKDYEKEILDSFSSCLKDLEDEYSKSSFKESQLIFIQKFNDFLLNQVCPKIFQEDLKGVFE